jgi:hypothetical protein
MLQQSTAFNVEASLNNWLSTALAAYDLPSWLPSLPIIVYDWREIAISLPCFSVIHIPVSGRAQYQGRNVGANLKGVRMTAMMDVSCWVSRDSANYSAQLRTMRDLVHSVATFTSGVVIKDYAADPASPADTDFRVVIGNVTGAPIALDENRNAPQSGSVINNPDILRARLLIDYAYTFRAM